MKLESQGGLKLDAKFAGYPVSMKKINDSYYVVCKRVLIPYSSYLLWKRDPTEKLMGYTRQGKPCEIQAFNGMVAIGCLKDTEENFNKIVKLVKTEIRNDKSSKDQKPDLSKESFISRQGEANRNSSGPEETLS